MEGSRPQYSFHHVGQDGLLYVFEAPIDLLSFLTLYPDRWQEHSYVALCGTGGQAIHWMLKQNTGLRDVVLCLDHDEPGQTAAKRIQEELQGAGYHSGILLPVHKDWNDDLVQGQTVTGSAMTMGQICRPQRRTVRQGMVRPAAEPGAGSFWPAQKVTLKVI